MHSQKMRLLSLNLVLVMLLTMLPVQAADIVVDDDGPMYTVVLNGNGGTYEGDDTLSISYGSSTLYLEDYIFTREGYTLLGWSKNENANTLDYTRFGELYASNIGNDTQLYAVWGEGENCALYTDAIPNADFIQLGQYYVVNSETLPAVNESGFVAWYDHINGVYYAGDTVRAGEVYRPICANMGNNIYPIILNGNGGKNKCGNGLVFCGATNDWFAWPLDRSFKKDNYILNGWTNSPESDAFVDVNYHAITFTDFTPVDGVVMLYAHWSPAYQLKDGAELVINGDTMNELLSMSSSSTGTGWRFTPGNSLNVYNQYGLSEHYSFGGIACNDGIAIHFDGDVSNGAIESGGMLGIFGDENTSLQISTHDTPAIQTSHLELSSEKMTYYLQTDEGVCVNASCICLSSPNITIVGNPAVRPDAQIISHNSGIGYTISEDKTTLTTFAIENKITLDGNGGTFDGQKTVDVDYDVSNKLDLSQYAFTREDYALIGWAADKDGSKFVAEYDGVISSTSYDTLYAVWIKVPESYAIFRIAGYSDRLTGAFDRVEAGRNYIFYSYDLSDSFVMPETTEGATVWEDINTHNLYYSGEEVVPENGSRFERSHGKEPENGEHTILLDGNGGTYAYRTGGVTYEVNRKIADYNAAEGETVNYACNFTRPGYTLASYNSEPDGSGKEYALNKCTVTADMEPIQILYAQWKEISADEPYISIDGKKYSAERPSWGDGWQYTVGSNFEHLFLTGYQGGNIEANVDLWITSSKKSAVTGSISAPNLTINVQEGSLSVTSAEGSALRATGELNISCNGEGAFEASGDPTALSCSKLIKDGYQTYLIRGGADKEHAEQITNDTFDNLSYISYERRDRVLTLHGNGGTTTDEKDTCTVSSKNSIIDLTAYAQTFTNGGRRLLGWSRQADASTIDYAAASDVSYSFDYWYEFKGDIYAVWEDDDRKGVVLNDYGYYTGQRYENNGSTLEYYRYAQQYTLPVSGETFTLPDSYRAGYTFTGWLGSDSKIYQAGAAIKIPTALSFTAQYTAGVIIVGGKAYSADRAQGSRELGWTYEPDRYTRYPSGYGTLRIYENYSGAPIQADGNLWVILSTNNDLTAPEGQPMIEVTGDLRIQTDWYTQGGESKPYTTKLAGGDRSTCRESDGNAAFGQPCHFSRR